MNSIKNQVKIGDGLKADNWKLAEPLREGAEFADKGFIGCQFRVNVKGYQIAVNVVITGKPKFNGFNYQSRCKIEFVGDCCNSIFSGGLLYQKNPLLPC